MRRKITVISATSDTSKRGCRDFTVMSMIIENSGSIIMQGCVYDSYLMFTEISSLLSKLPYLRNKSGFTFVQQNFEVLKDCIFDADEVICGVYKRDVGLVNKVYRSFRGTSINQDDCVLPIKQTVRELFYDVPNNDNKVTHRQLLDNFDVSIDDARDVACSVFAEEYWVDLPTSAIKAAVYLLSRLSELGYESGEVADTIFEHMYHHYNSEYAVQCFLGGGSIGANQERVTYTV